jgi:hypothetical protein
MARFRASPECLRQSKNARPLQTSGNKYSCRRCPYNHCLPVFCIRLIGADLTGLCAKGGLEYAGPLGKIPVYVRYDDGTLTHSGCNALY